ncbi:ComF family protein [Roseinatronobacter alkalisoli]|uniref:Double zinc ribbon domain-containing protein n=1 Tax=Roseinatronobacter alkalisoli TaxID=3028235 RepID=A0ABT5T6E7_9RHOB|nr:double zinc ribbon domain-containing protein [Roseinatronobacter sp. HJB301]MDD7970695.1 double zinc ribbon domain-containing protein [Roseinatronobacter sp. HJB301]
MLHAIYPPQCMTCDTLVEEPGALCPVCWRETGFIFGSCCDLCGTPLPGDVTDQISAICDDCLTIARPWEQGRAVMVYGDKARQILLGLKYHDRLDHAPVAAKWMSRAAQPLLQPDMLVAPVPLHWLRLLKRRYNQAAVLSSALAGNLRLEHCPDLLNRARYTGTQDGRGRMGRFANVEGAFRPNPRQARRISGRHILLVDDVMTAGATFAAATDTLLACGATSVRVIALARVAHAE